MNRERQELIRLCAENARLREALRGLLKHAPSPKGIRKDFSYNLYLEAARAALKDHS